MEAKPGQPKTIIVHGDAYFDNANNVRNHDNEIHGPQYVGVSGSRVKNNIDTSRGQNEKEVQMLQVITNSPFQ